MSDKLEVKGKVLESLPNAMFKIEIDDENFEVLKGKIILGHISGKMRVHHIRILPGDKVKLELSPYDLTKGRITYREK